MSEMKVAYIKLLSILVIHAVRVQHRKFLNKEILQTMQVGCGTTKLILLIYFSSTPF